MSDGSHEEQASGPEWWASEDFWRKCAIFVTAGMAFVLVVLTYHTHTVILAGAEAGRVPAYSVIKPSHRLRVRR